MAVPDPMRIARLRGWLHDMAHVVAHGIAGTTACGVVRFLGRTLEKLFENRDVELPGLTLLVLDLQSLARSFWYLLPLLLVVDLGFMRLGRRLSSDDRTAAGYSVGVMLVITLVMGFTTVMLVHPLATLVKPAK